MRLMGFIDNLDNRTGNARYVNSGVLRWKPLKVPGEPEGFDLKMAGKGLNDHLEANPGIYVADLTLPPSYLHQFPHIHPLNELALVMEGEYQDMDMEGKVIHTYPKRSLVWYNRLSTHRPLSRDGTEIFYIAFGGIIQGKDPRELLQKAKSYGIQEREDALGYALQFLLPFDTKSQTQIMDEVFSD
ncbi:MAG: hypothetical protein HY367_00690 [Candidatus Aenigmarchaeota archaeon]|nr:hypothetical protein [Candidatus Aenigmarchaeota archaeon]